MQLSPIVLFAYNRLQHLQQTVESLKTNRLAKDSELFIFSDAPKDNKAKEGVEAVRDYLKTIDGFKKVSICQHQENLGASSSIIAGVSEVVARYGKVIVLEDDLAVSQYFLNFMNDALLFYENEPRVISICGYMYPVKLRNYETLFLRMPDCWGWGAWKRGWDLLETDAASLFERLKSKKLLNSFDLNGGYSFSKLLKNQVENKVSSWAICWYASALLNDKLSLYPVKSLVKNIGLDNTGTHNSYSFEYRTDIFQKQILVSNIPLKEDRLAVARISRFFRINWFKKLIYVICSVAALPLKANRMLKGKNL